MPRDSITTNLPPSILQKYGKVTLGVDVLHINKVPYIFSTAKHIKFLQSICICNKTLKVYMKTFKRMMALYILSEFKVTKIYTGRAFEPCQLELAEMGIELVCYDTSTHVHFAERSIGFFTEHIRCIRLMLPKEIKRTPKRLMMELVYTTNITINSIRKNRGVHPVMHPVRLLWEEN